MSSDCASIPDAKFFNEKYRYPDWFTRKKLVFHQKMLNRLKKLRFLHSRASQYYDKMNFRMSTPSIVITSVSGIASFLSTSQYIDSDYQNAFGITVGVLASLASIVQAFSAACQYSVKREAHRTVAEQYNTLIVKTKFEMEMPNEEDFIDKLEVSILDIQSKCNYFIPQFILDEWAKKKETNITSKTDYNNDIDLFEPENSSNSTKQPTIDSDNEDNDSSDDSDDDNDEDNDEGNNETNNKSVNTKKRGSHGSVKQISATISSAKPASNESTYLLKTRRAKSISPIPHISINIDTDTSKPKQKPTSRSGSEGATIQGPTTL